MFSFDFMRNQLPFLHLPFLVFRFRDSAFSSDSSFKHNSAGLQGLFIVMYATYIFSTIQKRVEAIVMLRDCHKTTHCPKNAIIGGSATQSS